MVERLEVAIDSQVGENVLGEIFEFVGICTFEETKRKQRDER